MINEIEVARRAVADAFEARIGDAVSEMLVLFRRDIPEFALIDQPEVWDAIRRLTTVTRQQQAAAIRIGRVPADIPHDAESARLGIASGMSQDAVFRSYQLAGGVAWQTFMTATEGVDVHPDLRAELFKVVADLVRAYEDRLMAEVSAGIEREIKSPGRDSRRAWVLQVRRLLDGVSDSAEGLGYPLDADHLAYIAWGAGAAATVGVLRRALPNTAALEIHRVDSPRLQLWWGWLALGGEPAAGLAETISAIELPDSVQVAFGNPGAGLDGFRLSHRQAGGAYMVAERTGQRLATYREAALEAFLLVAEEGARDLARAELAGFDGEGATDRKLRDTLQAYFRCGQNAASTAATLGVNEQTVARRLAAVAGIIGCRVQERRAELEIALRTRALRERGLGAEELMRLG